MFAAVVKVYATSVVVQTVLTRTNSKDKYKKIANIEKTTKQIAKTASKPYSKSSRVSLDSRKAPKGLSSG